MTWNDFKKELLRDKKFTQVFYQKNLPQDLADRIFCERVAQGITQKQLGKLIGTTQSGIARIERGVSLPSITTLKKIAEVLKLELSISFTNTKHRQDAEDVRETLTNDIYGSGMLENADGSYMIISNATQTSNIRTEVYD